MILFMMTVAHSQTSAARPAFFRPSSPQSDTTEIVLSNGSGEAPIHPSHDFSPENAVWTLKFRHMYGENAGSLELRVADPLGSHVSFQTAPPWIVEPGRELAIVMKVDFSKPVPSRTTVKIIGSSENKSTGIEVELRLNTQGTLMQAKPGNASWEKAGRPLDFSQQRQVELKLRFTGGQTQDFKVQLSGKDSGYFDFWSKSEGHISQPNPKRVELGEREVVFLVKMRLALNRPVDAFLNFTAGQLKYTIPIQTTTTGRDLTEMIYDLGMPTLPAGKLVLMAADIKGGKVGIEEVLQEMGLKPRDPPPPPPTGPTTSPNGDGSFHEVTIVPPQIFKDSNAATPKDSPSVQHPVSASVPISIVQRSNFWLKLTVCAILLLLAGVVGYVLYHAQPVRTGRYMYKRKYLPHAKKQETKAIERAAVDAELARLNNSSEAYSASIYAKDSEGPFIQLDRISLDLAKRDTSLRYICIKSEGETKTLRVVTSIPCPPIGRCHKIMKTLRKPFTSKPMALVDLKFYSLRVEIDPKYMQGRVRYRDLSGLIMIRSALTGNLAATDLHDFRLDGLTFSYSLLLDPSEIISVEGNERDQSVEVSFEIHEEAYPGVITKIEYRLPITFRNIDGVQREPSDNSNPPSLRGSQGLQNHSQSRKSA